MRNSLVRTLSGFVLSVFSTLGSIAQENDVEGYLKQNAALVDARTRSIDKQFFVKELVWVDFNKSGSLPAAMDFQDEGFSDTGTGNDPVKGDGIYTSLNLYEHNEKVPYNEERTAVSVMNEVVTDKEFLYENSLQDFLANYNKPGAGSQTGRFVSVTCDILACICRLECASCLSCITMQGYFGAICMRFKNCKLTIGF